MKPHEETWDPDDVVNMAAHVAYSPERRRLAAQAPAMARLLLKLQWSGSAPGGDTECPSCHADAFVPVFSEGTHGRLVRHDDGTHAADCELAAVLRAAGVLP